MSDHISGPRALAEPIADITDLYVFPSPERAGHLVLVMNTLPFAQPSDLLSDGLIYRFRLRPLTRGPSPESVPFLVGDREFVFDCIFSTVDVDGEHVLDQEGSCTTPRGDTVTVRVSDERGEAVDGVRMFSGPQLDLSRRQERPQPRRRTRSRPAGGRRAGRCRGRDAHPGPVQRATGTGRAPGGEEHDARPEAVRSGEPGSRDPRPVQHGGRV